MGDYDNPAAAQTATHAATRTTPDFPATPASAAPKPHRLARAALAIALPAALLFLGVFLIFLLALPFPSQAQYQKATEIASALKWAGAKSWVTDFEDGDEPDGCCVIARQGDNQMQVVIDPQGSVAKVAYVLRVDGESGTDAASVNLELASMEGLLADSTSEIWTAITRVEIADKVLQRGLAKGKPAGAVLDTGQGRIRVAYSFANFKDYQLIRVALDAPEQAATN